MTAKIDNEPLLTWAEQKDAIGVLYESLNVSLIEIAKLARQSGHSAEDHLNRVLAKLLDKARAEHPQIQVTKLLTDLVEGARRHGGGNH